MNHNRGMPSSNQLPQGFLKKTRESDKTPALSPQQRIQLIRRGNELFNRGEIDQARKIFLTVSYTDGIIRLGDYYYKKNKIIEALTMYKKAPAPRRAEELEEKMAIIIQKWLREKG